MVDETKDLDKLLKGKEGEKVMKDLRTDFQEHAEGLGEHLEEIKGHTSGNKALNLLQVADVASRRSQDAKAAEVAENIREITKRQEDDFSGAHRGREDIQLKLAGINSKLNNMSGGGNGGGGGQMGPAITNPSVGNESSGGGSGGGKMSYAMGRAQGMPATAPSGSVIRRTPENVAAAVERSQRRRNFPSAAADVLSAVLSSPAARAQLSSQLSAERGSAGSRKATTRADQSRGLGATLGGRRSACSAYAAIRTACDRNASAYSPVRTQGQGGRFDLD